MFDFPIQDIKIVHEHVVDQSTPFQASNGAYYQMSEVDLSFSNTIAGMCSGDSSSGPVNRPTVVKKP